MRSLLLALLVLAACSDRSYSPVTPEALQIGTPVRVFAATTRQRDDRGSFGFDRSEALSLVDLTVSIPPNRALAEIDFAYAKPDPRRQFTLAREEDISASPDFVSAIRRELLSKPAGSRELVIFTHGYNTTHLETAFRAAQLSVDLNLPGTAMIYTWSSRGSPLGYAYDGDSMLFARQGLEQTLRLAAQTGAERIVLVAHSLGSALVMETLRQMEFKAPGWPGRELGGVVLISPDLDVDVFRQQMRAMKENVPQPFIVFASQKDTILNISARLRGSNPETRLGRIANLDDLSEFPIEVIDTTALSENAGSGHFIPATSPVLVSMLGQARQLERNLGSGTPSLGDFLAGRPDRRGQARRIQLVSEGERR